MGHATSIALGVCTGVPRVPVYAIEGDGSLLMHMGSMVTVGLRQNKVCILRVTNRDQKKKTKTKTKTKEELEEK
jgi:sulfopyruvate decarboxylase subunit beta